MTPTPVTVSPVPPAAAAPPVAAAPPAAAADVTALQRKVDELIAQNVESQRTTQFWYDKAQAAAPAVPKPAAAEEPEADILELATKGGKAFDQYLDGWAKKNGYVKGEAMTAAIEGKAAELAAQGSLVNQYPDLKNDKSDFFVATAAEYGALKKKGISEVDAMQMAAERTELKFLREGKINTPQQTAADAKATRDADRAARAAAGGGERSSRTPAETADDDALSEDDERAVRQLADGLEIPVEEARTRYIARAKSGVRVALKLDRRQR